ncbi:MAG: PAS domain-containing protein [Methanosarcinaceae archaeon]|nr:PAS domain-containing protein [Methanosarcinaceae archaeon]
MSSNYNKLKKNILIKISIAFIFTILLFSIKEFVPLIQDNIAWAAIMFILFGILYLSINKDIVKWNSIIMEKEDLVDTIFKKMPHPLGIFYADEECRIQYANDEFGELRGFRSRDDIIGKTPEAILGVEKSIVRKVLETGETIINRRRDPIMNYKGDVLHHIISCIPIKNKMGKIKGVLEILIDVTKLIEQEELTHQILKTIPYPSSVFFVNTEYKISYANDEFAKLRGFKEGEDIIWKEPEEILGVEKSIIREVIDTKKAIINEKRDPIIDHKGNKLYHLISCLPIKDNMGKLLGALEVLTDITKHRAQEELTKQIIRKMPYPTHVVFIDTDKKIRYADEDFTKFVKAKSVEDLIGKRISEVLDDEDIKKPITEMVIDYKEPILNKKLTLKKMNDCGTKEESIQVIVSCIPIEDEDNNLVGALETFIEISEIKHLCKELKDA